MSLFDKLSKKNKVLEPEIAPEYSANVTEEELNIMKHEATIEEVKPLTKADIEIETIGNILSSEVKPEENVKYVKKLDVKILEEKKKEYERKLKEEQFIKEKEARDLAKKQKEEAELEEKRRLEAQNNAQEETSEVTTTN